MKTARAWLDKAHLRPWAADNGPGLALAVFALLMVTRSPKIVTQGRFWAEEGKVYFKDAVSGSWFDALLAPRMGYYSAFNKLAALAASAVPLEFAPRVTVLCAGLVMLGVALFIIRCDAFPTPGAKGLGLAALLFAVPSSEVWLNTINSQFYFAVGTAILLVTARGRIGSDVRLAFLLLAGLTGPVSVFLVPFFLYRAWRERTGWAYAEAAVLTLCTLVQAALVLQGLTGGARAGAFAPQALAAAIAVKSLILPWFGATLAQSAASALSDGPALPRAVALAGTLLMAGLLALVVARRPPARWLALMGTALVVLSCAGALQVDPWGLVIPGIGGRYAFATNVLWGLALVAVLGAAEEARWRRFIATLMLAAFLLTGASAFWSRDPLLSGPNWTHEVRAWRAGPPAAPLKIWPPGWELTLAP